MKKIKIVFILLSFLLAVSFAATPHAEPRYTVCFTPGQNCSAKIVTLIQQSKKSIYMQGYSFTSSLIAHALIKAHERGVKLYILLDKLNLDCNYFSFASLLVQKHIPVFISTRKGLAHNKVMVFDRSIVQTGSFNYTRAAQRQNAENVLIIYDKKLAQAYIDNWYRQKQAAKPLKQMPCHYHYHQSQLPD